jgi:hypothetical protein
VGENACVEYAREHLLLRLGVELPGAAAGRGGGGSGCGIDNNANDDRGSTGCGIDGSANDDRGSAGWGSTGCALACGPTGIA